MATPAFAAGAYSAASGAAKAFAQAPAAAPQAGAGAGGFGDMLSGVLKNTAETGKIADRQNLAAVQGKADMINVVTAVAESEAAIETLVAVRDRVIAAYEDIMRMPI